MTVIRSRQRFDSFRIPEHVLVVNYFGIPVDREHLFFGPQRLFPSCESTDPMMGLLLLSDMIFPGGLTLAQLGSDHI